SRLLQLRPSQPRPLGRNPALARPRRSSPLLRSRAESVLHEALVPRRLLVASRHRRFRRPRRRLAHTLGQTGDGCDEAVVWEGWEMNLKTLIFEIRAFS